jgi:hypothetical protein
METYATHYCSQDVWRHSLPKLYRIDGRLIPDEELIDPVSMRRSEFYCDFLKQFEVGRLVCGVVHPSDSPAVAGGLLLSIFKPGVRRRTLRAARWRSGSLRRVDGQGKNKGRFSPGRR